MLSKRNLKKNDKKSGRKKPRPNDGDIEILPAPDFEEAQLIECPLEPQSPKTPKTPAKLKTSAKLKTPGKLKTPSKQKAVSTPKSTKRLKFADNGDSQDHQILLTDSPPPVKKAKLNMAVKENKPIPTAWINGLNSDHKQILENNEWLCSEIINACCTIISRQFPNVSGSYPDFSQQDFHLSLMMIPSLGQKNLVTLQKRDAKLFKYIILVNPTGSLHFNQ
ncbi:unnamed protein product [Mytilus coruscus]|uniref:Uncharacterized protein n=1 Tax=Mytilus coruscus TaxID=42192 RepID=A0A6J8D8V6_MYTCO|nr:unnamed protein product [Mytilus coruscus]